MQDLARAFLKCIPFSMRDRIKAIPGVAQLQRAIVSRMLNGREFEHVVDAGPAKGVRFAISMPEDKGIWTGTYEIDFASRLAAAVTRGTVAYDIGSWHGFFAGVMAARGASHVHVFEPLPVNAERIRSLIRLNPKLTITIHECAIGEGEAEMNLMVMPDTSMAKLEYSTFQANETSNKRVRVTVRSIDGMVLAGEIAPPGLMKIDVEGAEALVLAGARETIRRYRPVIFAEVHSASLLDQCRQFLNANNYTLEFIGANLAAARGRDVFQIKATPGG